MLRQLRLSLLLVAVLFLATDSAGAQNLPAPVSLAQQMNSQLAELATRVLDHANRAACNKKSCSILVANFVNRSGSTSLLGMQLADAFSDQLALQARGIQIVERSRLRAFLEQERIPSKLLDENAMSWLAYRLSASAIVIGHFEKKKTSVPLRVQLQYVLDGQKEKTAKTTLIVQDADRLLSPAEPFGNVPHVHATPEGEKIFVAGKDGTTMPSCAYHPDPQYSDQARDANFNGIVLIEMTLKPDQSVGNIQVVSGAPFGLNDKARKAVATWRCKPASLNGTLVPARVLIEITFRRGN